MITSSTHCWSRERSLIWWGRIEDAILSLETMPYRCPERKRGAYANRGYRQLFVENYTVVFRIDEAKKTVIVVTVRYSPSEF